MLLELKSMTASEWWDITSLIADEGFQYALNGVDGPSSGRSELTGDMDRDKVADKDRLDVSLIPLTQAETERLFPLLREEFIQARYLSPYEGIVLKTVYSNNTPATCAQQYPDGSVLWKGVRFPLIER